MQQEGSFCFACSKNNKSNQREMWLEQGSSAFDVGGGEWN